MSLIQPPGQRVIRTFKAHCIWYSLERIINTMEENPNRENIMEVWKDYTIENAIFIGNFMLYRQHSKRKGEEKMKNVQKDKPRGQVHYLGR